MQLVHKNWKEAHFWQNYISQFKQVLDKDQLIAFQSNIFNFLRPEETKKQWK